MMDFTVPRPVITVMSGERRRGFVGVNVSAASSDQVDVVYARLEKHARNLANNDGIDWDAGNIFMLGIVMPCGSRFLFRRADDMPRETLPCNCGDPDHIVVKISVEATAGIRQPVWP